MALTYKQGTIAGDWIATVTGRFINRTGSTLSAGDLVAVDIVGSSTEASAYATWLADTTPTEAENPFANVVAVTDGTDGIGSDDGFFVVANESVADNAWGEFTISGICKINSGTSTAVTDGSQLVAVTATQAVRDYAATDTARVTAIALQDGATGTTATTSWCIFDGANMGNGLLA